MALNIRNPETERLADALAKITGETKTEAVTKALRARLDRVRRERSRRRLADELDESRYGALPARRTTPGALRRSSATAGIEQARAARTAFCRFGRGRHAAGLNYGDCFSYALASVRGEPLLYKGDDFSLTDIASSAPAR